MQNYVYKIIKSPIGNLKLVGSKLGLAAILWENENIYRVSLDIISEDKQLPIFLEAEKQLNQYFEKKRINFDLQLDFNGTNFQKKVWQVLLEIPYGKVTSYSEIAKKIGIPKAARAVGAASSRNPISIVIACHRVVGFSGKLIGYAGGIQTKARLIELEGGTLSGQPHQNTRVISLL